MTQVLLSSEPFTESETTRPWIERGHWPARWIGHPQAEIPFVAVFQLRFVLEHTTTLRVHVSADERYELWLDGARQGRGPERGDTRNWFFESYDFALTAGTHIIVARVTALGAFAPFAQVSLRPGFLLCPDDSAYQAVVATGCAPWQVSLLEGLRYTSPMGAFAIGHRIVVDGTRYGWGWEQGKDQSWVSAVTLRQAVGATLRNEILPDEHSLTPATLLPQLDTPRQIGRVRHLDAPTLSATHSVAVCAEHHLATEAASWQALLDGNGPLTVPPNTRRRLIIDLDDYYCAYPELIVSGGVRATLRLNWQESLFVDEKALDKGDRNAVEGKYFSMMWAQQDGLGDSWTLDGGQRRLETLWWMAGRYVELLVETDNAPLTVERITFYETRYPLEAESRFVADDARLADVAQIALRGLQMCAHETYMDCPFYEQLQYVGDTRLECLVTYAISRDDRLPRKALRLFDASRLPGGFTQSRYPSRLRQLIPPFALWWVCMVHDYLYWRDDPAFVRSLLPGQRAVLDAFTALRGADSLLRSPHGWNYIDWVQAWAWGEPPGASPGEVCGPLNWQYVYSLRRAAEVEAALGEPELAARCLRLANETAAALDAVYWEPARGLYADDEQHQLFTEHSQCLAVLSGSLLPERRAIIAEQLFAQPDLTRPTVYFAHYYLETCRALGRMDAFYERLAPWFLMKEYGFRTTYENADPHGNRSDCHAWGAHPLYHSYASLLGVRPSAPGFAEVTLAPQPGPLQQLSATMVHPRGTITLRVEQHDDGLHGVVTLPDDVRGVLQLGGQSVGFVGKIEF